MEKDREATEQKLLDTIGEEIASGGFEKIGVNAVASKAGVSKMLIYRYFGSMDGLIAAYIKKKDFWINLPHEMVGQEQLGPFLKQMFYNQVKQMREDKTIRRLYRWELSTNNRMIEHLREQRETTGLWIIDEVGKLVKSSHEDVAAMATIVSAAITYLVMLEEFCPSYNGIPLDEDKGWDQIIKGIDIMIDLWLKNNTIKNGKE